MADSHIRETKPVCRKDKDWLSTMLKKLTFIKEVKNDIRSRFDYDIPLLHAGDIFDSWNASIWFFASVLRSIPKLIMVAGNHDLPAHNIKNIYKSVFYLLSMFDGFDFLYKQETIDLKMAYGSTSFICGFPYGTELTKCENKWKEGINRSVALIHKYVYKGRKPFPGATGSVNSILDQLEGFDLVVSGDNHIPFTHKNKRGQLLVNCGSMLRLTADQANHKPRIWAWYADENEAVPIYLPIEDDVVSTEHIEQTKERNDRIDAFVSSLQSSTNDLHFDFHENLKQYCIQNEISKPILEKIHEAIE